MLISLIKNVLVYQEKYYFVESLNILVKNDKVLFLNGAAIKGIYGKLLSCGQGIFSNAMLLRHFALPFHLVLNRNF